MRKRHNQIKKMNSRHNPDVKVYHASHKKRHSLPFSKNTNRVAGVAIVVMVASFGYWLLDNTFANEPTVSNIPSSTCGARVTNYTYKVPFGNAVWNQPVCNLPKHPQSANYASRFFNFSYLNNNPEATKLRGRVSTDIGMPVPTLTDPEGLSTLFSRNVYLASEATTRVKVQTSVYPSNLDGTKWEGSTDPDRQKYLPDTSIPWNPSWRTGEGGDNEIVILDDVTGKGLIYGISGYKRDLAAITQCGPVFRDRICAYDVSIGRDMNGNIIDYRTYEGPTGDRGVGLSYYATLVTPDEVLAGEIRHALGVSIPNTAVGPICTPAQLGTTAEGRTCGTAVAPASKFEWSAITAPKFMPEPFKSFYTQDKLIPEGMRFALNIDDVYIENWINSRPDLKSNNRLAQTARIFARAMRDYGMIIVDTNGNNAEIQLSGSANPKTKEKWQSLGMSDEVDNSLLDGLVTSSNIYVVDTPTVTCKDGSKSKYYCRWTTASYGTTPTTTQPTPVPEPTPINTPPSVNLGALNTTYVAPANITLSATASDPDGIAKVEFFNGSIKLGEDTTSPYTYGWKNIAEGIYAVSVRATDKKGLSTTTSRVNISVKSASGSTTPPPPSTIIPPTTVSIPQNTEVGIKFNWSLFEFDQSLTLNWSASTSPNGIKNYIINKNGRRLYEGTSRQFIDFNVNNGQRYRYDIYAIDNKGFISQPATYNRTFSCDWLGLSCRY